MTSTSASAAVPGGMPQNVVVLGASGFIGRNLVQRLSGRVARLIGVSRRRIDLPGMESVLWGDLSRLQLSGETIAVHLAAHRYNADAFREAQSDILVENAAILGDVFRFCVRVGIEELRMASSIAVYPGSATRLDDGVPIDLSQDPAESERMYGWSKRMGEIYARLYRQQYGLHTLSFRLSNPYGPWDETDPRKAHVVPAFIVRALTTSGPFAVRGNPAATRDFIAVSDVCTVLERSLGMRKRHDVYNLATGQNTSIRELARTILDQVGSDRELVLEGAATSSVMHRACDVRRLCQDFAVDTFVAPAEGLRSTIDWYRHAIPQR